MLAIIFICKRNIIRIKTCKKQIYSEFPEGDNSSIKAAISGAAKLGIFPVCVLNISNTYGTAELLLCYNEFGVFVDENGRRTRAIDPVWNHLPFAFGIYQFSYTLK